MPYVILGLFLTFCPCVAMAQTDDFFDGLIISEEMKQEEIGQSGQEQARKLLESKPTILKVKQQKIRAEEIKPEDAAPVIREPAPFGLKWLASEDEIKYLNVRLRPTGAIDQPHTYIVTNLPKPATGFREVLASFGDDDSLWHIAAYGKLIEDDESASKGVGSYRKYYQMLAKKYGNPQQFYTPAVINVDEAPASSDNVPQAAASSDSLPQAPASGDDLPQAPASGDNVPQVAAKTKKLEIGGKGFLQKLISGESTLYSTFDNGKIGVTLALLADGAGQTYIVIDYKNLTATQKEDKDLYDSL